MCHVTLPGTYEATTIPQAIQHGNLRVPPSNATPLPEKKALLYKGIYRVIKLFTMNHDSPLIIP